MRIQSTVGGLRCKTSHQSELDLSCVQTCSVIHNVLLKILNHSERFAEVNVCGNSSKIYTAVVPADVEKLCRTSFLTPNHRIRLLCGHYHQTRVIIITVRTAETLCQLIMSNNCCWNLFLTPT